MYLYQVMKPFRHNTCVNEINSDIVYRKLNGANFSVIFTHATLCVSMVFAVVARSRVCLS